MRKLLRSALAAGLIAAALSANAQDDDQASFSFDGRDDSRECGTGNGGFFFFRNILKVVGLTSDQRLVCFDEYRPGKARTIGTVSGLGGGDTFLIGIDFRVQDGKLYGVGNAGGVYTLDVKTAAATLVNRLTVPLSGTRFGVDFNPAADRLRIVSDNGQNLRHNVNAGGVTLADAALNYTPGTAATGVTGSAYTNNDLSDQTATTLYALDSTLDQIAIQSPPNNGSLVATGKLTVDTNDMTGFDIYSIVRNNVTLDVTAFASLAAPDGESSFYEIILPTGKAHLRGSFDRQNQVVDIAIPLNQ
jgi:hypothetical protein